MTNSSVACWELSVVLALQATEGLLNYSKLPLTPGKRHLRNINEMTMTMIFKRLLLSALLLLALSSYTKAQTAWRDSLATLNRLIAENPTSADLRLKKAAVNIELGQWDYAVEEYTRVLQSDARNLAALYFRAYANVNRQQYGQAKADYETFLSIAPLHMEARLGLATVCQRLGRVTDARDELNRLVEMFPDSAVAYAARASFETAQQQYDVAIFDWDAAISRSPHNADYVVSKVDALLAVGRKKEALQTLDDAQKRGIPRGLLRDWIDLCRSRRD